MHCKQTTLVRQLFAAGAFGLLAASPALVFAQATSEPQRVEKIEVTGSNIKRVDAETAAPIQIITRTEIEKSGKQTVAELLAQLPIAGTGGLNDLTSQNSFSSGVSTVSLRGLGSSATLVLLNGRRVAPVGQADPNFGQSAVVNLDSFPVNVIERIEILKDGASAIYGSEAVAGVINIILRKDFTGAEASSSFSTNSDSEYRTVRASVSGGWGDLAKDRYNVFATFEHTKRYDTTLNDVTAEVVDPRLTASGYATGRHFSSSYADNYLNSVIAPNGTATVTSFKPAAQQPANCVPTAVKDAAGICRFDLVPRTDFNPASTRDNLFLKGTIDFTANLTGFAEYGFNRTKTYFVGNPQVYGDFGAWYSSTQQRLVNLVEALPVGNPSNPFNVPTVLRHRFVEVGNFDRQSIQEATRVVGGLKGTAGTWDWETGVLYSQNKSEVDDYNQIRYSVLNNAIINGTYNFLNPSAGAVKPDQLRINTVDNAKSDYTILDLKGSSELLPLPGGMLAIAAGGEYRRETRSATPDAAKAAGEVIGAGASVASGSRNVVSVYGELSIPILRNLETQLAVRTDKYSDYGRSTTPKFGFKWKALPTLALRGSFAKAFRAPSLTEISPSSVTAFTTITDPLRCITGAEADCARGIAALLQSNTRLQPETAKTANFGFIWDPVKNASLTVDYFDIRRNNEITTLDLNLIFAHEGDTSGLYANRIIRGPAIGDGLPGPIQAISIPFVNATETHIRGIDTDIQFRFNLSEYGKVNTHLFNTYFQSWKTNTAEGDPLLEFVAYRIPRTRSSLLIEWEYGDFTYGLTENYVRGYHVSSDPRISCAQASLLGTAGVCEVPAATTADLNVHYTGIKNLTLNFTARNITNKHAPLDPLARPVNQTYFPNYQGTYFTLGATYRFK